MIQVSRDGKVGSGAVFGLVFLCVVFDVFPAFQAMRRTVPKMMVFSCPQSNRTPSRLPLGSFACCGALPGTWTCSTRWPRRFALLGCGYCGLTCDQSSCHCVTWWTNTPFVELVMCWVRTRAKALPSVFRCSLRNAQGAIPDWRICRVLSHLNALVVLFFVWRGFQKGFLKLHCLETWISGI